MMLSSSLYMMMGENPCLRARVFVYYVLATGIDLHEDIERLTGMSFPQFMMEALCIGLRPRKFPSFRFVRFRLTK